MKLISLLSILTVLALLFSAYSKITEKCMEESEFNQHFAKELNGRKISYVLQRRSPDQPDCSWPKINYDFC